MARIAKGGMIAVAASNAELDAMMSSLRSEFGCGPVQQRALDESFELIRELVMNQGVSIDECAEKFDTHPIAICKIMGWI